MNRERVPTQVLLSFLMIMFLLVIGCSKAEDAIQNIVDQVTIHNITGTVTLSGSNTPLAGVTISLVGVTDTSLSATTVTDAYGSYSFKDKKSGVYMVTPIPTTLYTFDPLTKEIDLTTGDVTQNFTAMATTTTLSIVFNYDYDTNGFFTTERRALVEQAAATFLARMGSTTWEQVDPSVTGGSYDLPFINPSTLAVTWSNNVVIPKNQITVYLGAVDFSTTSSSSPMHSSKGSGCSQLMSIRNVSGNIGTVLTSASKFRPVNSSITFDLQGIQGFSSARTIQWHFDSDGNLSTDDRNTSDPHYNDYVDFSSALIHELGHVLGIFNPQQNSILGIDFDSNFCLAWMNLVQSDGSGGYVFTGSNAKQLYYGHVGVNIPLETSSECHWADGVRSGPSGDWSSVTHEAGAPFRVWFSEMEFQALKDIGYTISAP